MEDPQSDALKYPTGRFSSVRRPLTPEERAARIEAIRALPSTIRAAVAGLDDRRLDTPYREGGWTLRQVVHHVVDSHTNAYIRFKLAVTEDRPTIKPYQEKLWAELPDARTLPVEASLAILDALHARWVAFLQALEPEHFGRPLRHPETGDFTVDMMLELYAWHGAHHVAHITGLRARKGW
ncbi:MAG: YfiT family bacillithiol transferase [Longimicrobiales bacterium]